ncbi:MAG: helix-turn-helix transcriptional regulator [Acidimicrobiia bacterium]|nr:helix-turn-helix transcriptional regulator [Acidimicrobiia bacterium]
MTSAGPLQWTTVVWVFLNLVLFTVVFVYMVRLATQRKGTSIGRIATAMVLVIASLLVASVQRLGIHAARAGLVPATWEDSFLGGYQLVQSFVASFAGVYAFTRLRASLRRVEEGERMVRVLTEGAPLDTDVSEWGLTARELQVLETIVAGRTSDEQIAETLFIATSTAATHVRNILRKAGLSNRMDLMLVGGRAQAREDRG